MCTESCLYYFFQWAFFALFLIVDGSHSITEKKDFSKKEIIRLKKLTSQCLEFDYVGVIIGEDMRFDGEHIVTDFNMCAVTDRSMFSIEMYKWD